MKSLGDVKELRSSGNNQPVCLDFKGSIEWDDRPKQLRDASAVRCCIYMRDGFPFQLRREFTNLSHALGAHDFLVVVKGFFCQVDTFQHPTISCLNSPTSMCGA